MQDHIKKTQLCLDAIYELYFMFKAGGGGDVSSEEDSDPECPNIQVCSYFLVFLVDDLAYNIGT